MEKHWLESCGSWAVVWLQRNIAWLHTGVSSRSLPSIFLVVPIWDGASPLWAGAGLNRCYATDHDATNFLDKLWAEKLCLIMRELGSVLVGKCSLIERPGIRAIFGLFVFALRPRGCTQSKVKEAASGKTSRYGQMVQQ